MKINAALVLTLLGASTASAANPAIAETKLLYGQIKTNIMKAAEKMPDAAYDFAATPEERTFGALIGHIADAQTRICGSATGDVKPANAGKLTAKAELVAALKASFDICDAALETVTEENATASMTFMRGQRSKIGILNYNVIHDNESYGTLAVYMRLKGIVPPSSEK